MQSRRSAHSGAAEGLAIASCGARNYGTRHRQMGCVAAKGKRVMAMKDWRREGGGGDVARRDVARRADNLLEMGELKDLTYKLCVSCVSYT